MNQNSNNNNNAPLTGVTKIKDGEPYYEIRNIKTSDKKFTLKGMPFTRKISNPNIWVTSHVKGPEFMQLGTALEIPTEIFFGTGYREIEDEETKEQKLKKAKQDYDTVMTKDANTWTANDQQKVTEYNKRLTEKQTQLVNQLEQKTINPSVTKTWSLFGNQGTTDIDEKPLFGENEISQEPVIPQRETQEMT